MPKKTKSLQKSQRKKLSRPKKLTGLTLFIGLLFYLMNFSELTTQSVVIPEDGKPALFYSNQSKDDLRQTFVKAIEEANHSILLLIYSLTDPQIIQSLKDKAKQGVQITIIHDPDTAKWGFDTLSKQMQCLEKQGSGLMHRKILVIDKEKIWIGSANFTTDSLKVHDNLVIGLVSRQLAERIRTSLCYQTPQLLARPPPEFMIAGQSIEFWSLPEDKQLALARVLTLINQCQKELKVAMFTWTHPEITEAVIQASKRGVKVEIVIDHQSGLGVSSLSYEKLKEAGVNVALSSGNGLLHHKFAYIDKKILINGSANWTKAAFTKNDDCFLVIHDLKDEQIAKLDKIWHVIAAQRERL